MYGILKSVIENQNYELTDMLHKIDIMWAKGSITEEQQKELVELARRNADPAFSIDILARLDDIETRLRKIENTGGKPVGPTDEYPQFEPNHVYFKGDKVTFEGKKYECVLNEYTDNTTWSPKDYPNYWKEVV